MVKSVNEAFINGELSITMKQCVITCIPKGDKDKTVFKNWRPISLLNVSYKIALGAMANQLKCVLPNLINDNQKCFYQEEI